MWLHNVNNTQRNLDGKEELKRKQQYMLGHKGKEVDVISEWAIFISIKIREIKTSLSKNYESLQ